MELPKYHETFIPILTVLSDGSIIHYNELRKRVKDQFYSDLPMELLNLKTKAGDPLILNRIGWVKAFLKQAEMIHHPERALVQITDKGRKILKQGHFTLKELVSDPDFLANRKASAEGKSEAVIEENASPQDRIDSGFRDIEGQLKSDLLEKLKSTDPYDFEVIVNRLLYAMGYGEFKVTAKSGDGGVDGIIDQDKLGLEKIYMQAKRYTKGDVGGRDMTHFIGAVSRDGINKGIFVTTSSFSESAKDIADRSQVKVKLIDGDRLVSLMVEYNIGVQIKTHYEIKQLDEDFFEDE